MLIRLCNAWLTSALINPKSSYAALFSAGQLDEAPPRSRLSRHANIPLPHLQRLQAKHKFDLAGSCI
ncbi:hypothetical protein ALQ88_02195 [Pseudomonas savastanoi]|nr:hypothetical protein ALQ88_02195 [Pseudomonas savastanoi]